MLQLGTWKGHRKLNEEERVEVRAQVRAHRRGWGRGRVGGAWGELPMACPPPLCLPGFSCLSCSPELLNLVISVVLGGAGQQRL